MNGIWDEAGGHINIGLRQPVPTELQAPEDFRKWRYNQLDTSATRVA